MLVLRLRSDGIWDIEMRGCSATLPLKKIKGAETVNALVRNTPQTTDYFYPVLRTAARLGQPIWVNMAEVQAMHKAVGLP